MFNDEDHSIFERLSAPFDYEKISWRVGATNKKAEEKRTGDNRAKPTKGIALAYIDARDVMERLDEVTGGMWQASYSHAGQRVICDLSIKIDGEWVAKANGAGDTQVEADKGAISDAFKRAGVMWGIGRYLYSMPNKWLQLDASGYNFHPDTEKELRDTHKMVADEILWGSRAERVTLKAYIQAMRSQIISLDAARIWRETQAGMINQFRVKAKEHVWQALDAIEEELSAKEAA